jgi:hypothetical protein
VRTENYLPDIAGAVSGVTFSALLFLSIASFNPLREATDAELTAWWSDSGNLRDNVISMYLMLASVPFFLVFMTALRGRLAMAEEDRAGVATLVFAAGLCFAAALIVTAVSRGMIAQSVKFTDEPLPGLDTLRTVDILSSTTFGIAAMPAAAFMMGAASWLILRSKVMAAWLGWLGAVAAVAIGALTLMLIAPFVLPLIFLWVAGVSIELWRTRQPVTERRADALPTARQPDSSTA